jgi:hypothetical protein
MTSMGLAEHIKRKISCLFALHGIDELVELHLLEYKEKHLDYLRNFQNRRISPLRPDSLNEFSGPWDMTGYADNSITDDLITDLYLEFSEQTRRVESDKYLRTLTGKVPYPWKDKPVLTVGISTMPVYG